MTKGRCLALRKSHINLAILCMFLNATFFINIITQRKIGICLKHNAAILTNTNQRMPQRSEVTFECSTYIGTLYT